MPAGLDKTPSANRTHIVFLGAMNSGKSTLVNAFANQQIAIVSDVPGTTTDAVERAMEIHGVGPCVLVDTAGFDDKGELGELRVNATRKRAMEADVVVLLLTKDTLDTCKRWHDEFEKRNIPVIPVVNKIEEKEQKAFFETIEKERFGDVPVISTDAQKGIGVNDLKKAVVDAVATHKIARSITGDLVGKEDVVLLVMPQDKQAPEGRLILPQVQTIRELLDKTCVVISTTMDSFEAGLMALSKPPKLIITDSQVFDEVYQRKPKESLLTSFSVLFAAYKGDIEYYVESVKAIAGLTEQSKVLIAECCTHAPLEEDIGRVKIPAMLRKKVGSGLTVEVVGGRDFPDDLSDYDLIIQCGACMFGRNYVMARLSQAKEQKVPMTNYGITIAYMRGILDKIEICA
ncbi:MAG: [FeFe] hydrogenase H-cluster maturation GTPase HydF [Lachnospiraceae bacterium]|nr:[FeFe] hydrogenase H-cluster maturation GTPase HydF [Lachnospiraceae bacterium]